jgi:hypothetical protein
VSFAARSELLRELFAGVLSSEKRLKGCSPNPLRECFASVRAVEVALGLEPIGST